MNNTATIKREENGYRKGVLLGLTVAEIILLLLFALLLALWGQIASMKAEVSRAKIINSKFSEFISKNENLNSIKFKEDIEKIIKSEIDYAEKLSKELEKYKNNLLPDDVFEKIKSENFDLNKLEDREKFFNIIKLATLVEKDSETPKDDLLFQCEAGKKVLARTKGADPERIFSDLDHWKKEAAACGKITSLPPCYQLNGKDVAIFEARLNDQGILLKDTVPADMRATFMKDFPTPPITGKSLSDSEFRSQTSQFIKYSKEKECKFRVNAYDDTGSDKKYFQRIEKVLDSTFYKWKHW
jgi:hypothetical protein